MTQWYLAIIGGVVALALSIAAVPLACRAALRWGITDRPGEGKAHTAPTPYLGGVAVVVAVAAAALVGGWRGEAAALVGSAVLVACIGLMDDLKTARPSVRVVVEAMAASIVFAAGARVQLFGGVADWALTVAWLVVLTNAYNLLDNMDGCASSVVFTNAIALVVLAALGDQVLVGALAATTAGAAAGFLVYNWHPALIFLGDAGSLFFGFLLSATALKLRLPVSHASGVVVVALVVGVALFDTTLVVLSRLSADRPIYVGGCDHTSHRLVRLGFPTRWVAPVLGAASAAFGALGIAVARSTITPFILVPVALVAVTLIRVLLRMPVYAEGAGRIVAARCAEVPRPELEVADAS